MYTVLKLFRPFKGNVKADVAPGENEFDTPALTPCSVLFLAPNPSSPTLPVTSITKPNEIQKQTNKH